ncbi:hypothetical protein [Halostella sp. PRR32]|nr:hypothetical protein [Halostella sp. PRR32]
MTLWHDEDENELVCRSGTQEFRLELKDHEREELARIVDGFRDDSEE